MLSSSPPKITNLLVNSKTRFVKQVIQQKSHSSTGLQKLSNFFICTLNLPLNRSTEPFDVLFDYTYQKQ